jgi:hypothetical protein
MSGAPPPLPKAYRLKSKAPPPELQSRTPVAAFA